MCGIAGKIHWDPEHPVDPGMVRAMADMLAHRGPDDSDVHCRDGAGLGHRRLSIIDLSAAGLQPMPNEDESVWLVFNGEIYNFPELRKELQDRGHTFRSESDSEVILHLYEEIGERVVERLRGMFAFGLWDARERKLLLARDRVGKKPLFYRLTPDGIAFASQPKAFYADPSFTAEPDLQALDYCLGLQYIPAPLSAFKGVRKLAPAHVLIATESDVREERYWRLEYGPKIQGGVRELEERLIETFRDAVRVRLLSDVPLGALLSGGLDSSAVVAMMAELVDEPVRTFSAGFREDEYDEQPYARRVAERFGTLHTATEITANATELVPRLAWHYDEPFGDSSALPTYLVAEAARREVKVVLNGDGGDESFAGYLRHAGIVLAHRLRRIPEPLARHGGRILGGGRNQRSGAGVSRIARFLVGLHRDLRGRYFEWVSHFTEDWKERLYTDELGEHVREEASRAYIKEAWGPLDDRHPVDMALSTDVSTYLPGDLLVKMDVATMAHGLEARSPFLDQELMQLVARFPARAKLRYGISKYILKRSMRGRLPWGIRYRKKQGFGVPLDRWFRGELRDMTRDVLLDERARQRGYFRPETVERLIRQHESGEAQWHQQLWNLLMMEWWHRLYIDREPPHGAP